MTEQDGYRKRLHHQLPHSTLLSRRCQGLGEAFERSNSKVMSVDLHGFAWLTRSIFFYQISSVVVHIIAGIWVVG